MKLISALGKIVGVYSATEKSKSIVRPKKSELELIKEFGIKDDKFAGKNLNRVVMIVGTDTYKIAAKEGIELSEGSLGENILLDFNPHALDIGTHLIIGESILEISEKCSICSHLSGFDPRLPNLVSQRRGLYCRIINGGIIKKGMEVYKGEQCIK